MPIKDTQLKGNWGEQFIASVLSSQGCLVRHVPQGQDSGIDLYCERVEAGEPFLHFWCQIKTSSKWNGKRKSVKYSPKQKHVEYWLKQPAPVFVFLVPDGRSDNGAPFYICSAFSDLYRKSILKISSSIELDVFLNSYLRYESFLWDLKNGKVSHLKTPTFQYIKKIPKGVTLPFEKKLQLSLLWTLHRLADDFLFDETIQIYFINKANLNKNEVRRVKESQKYIKALEEFVNLINDKHYHNYETIGMYYELENKIRKAKKYYKHSLYLLELDPNKVWEQDIKRVKEHLQRVSSKL